MVCTMKWDPILKKYPDDIEHVRLARQIYESMQESLQAIDIPELDPSIKNEDIITSLDYAPLAGICREVWEKVFASEPDVDMERSIGAFIRDELLPELSEEQQDLAAMFVRPAVTLYLAKLREKNKDSLKPAHNSGECPFCLAYPRIAFDSETARQLNCLLCGQEWEFHRIKCPYCGNEDHETLGYFEAEGIEGVKVYYCDQCKYYIKVIDTREREVLDAETEDILTLVMDEVAQQEGYR
jgi:formate dehydrogenase accessory protein FdhE